MGGINTKASQVISSVYQMEGAMGFWKGVVPRMSSSTVSCAFLMTGYEIVKQVAKTTYQS